MRLGQVKPGIGTDGKFWFLLVLVLVLEKRYQIGIEDEHEDEEEERRASPVSPSIGRRPCLQNRV